MLSGIFGAMGMGKSFEGVSQHVLPAIKAGRRVVSTIDGLNHQAFSDYLDEPIEKIHELLIVTTNDILADDSAWYDPVKNDRSIIQPGDLVVVDEAWEIFSDDKKLSERVQTWIAMQRHYAHPATGQTSDLVVLSQDKSGLNKFLKQRMSLSFECRKQLALSRSNSYSLYVFEGKQRKPLRREDKKYDKKIFPLYQSYNNGAQGVEHKDSRQSIFNSKLVKFGFPLGLLAVIFGIYFAFKKIHDFSGDKAFNKGAANAKTAPKPPPGVAAAPATTVATTGSSSAAPAAIPSLPAKASDWRLMASYKVGTVLVVELVNERGQIRKLTPGSYTRGASDDFSVVVPDTPANVAAPYTGPAVLIQQSEHPQVPPPSTP
jgi:zona occludens toxin